MKKILLLLANLLWLFATPFQTASADAVAASSCRPGFTQQGYWLCMTGVQPQAQYMNAAIYCQDKGGRVANENDWYYRIWRGDGFPAPVGFWLGNIAGDDNMLYVNMANWSNFEGVANKFDSRNYVCAHDLIR